MDALSPAGKILVIEDDPDARANLRDILEMDDYAVDTAQRDARGPAERGRSATSRSSSWTGGLPDGNALDFLPRLETRPPMRRVMIVTAHSDLEGAIEALRHGAADYILKPINADSLRIRVGRIMEQRRLALAKERSDSVFRNLVEAAECMIVMLRPADHAILYFSPFAEHLTGYRPARCRGRASSSC